MKNLWTALLLCLSLVTVCLAGEKVEAPLECQQCGMDRTFFAHSRMIVTYTDGISTGTCSINCVVTDLNAAKGKEVKSYQVADYMTKKLIDAKSATWVIGGMKKGVMTTVAKWAFADKKGAESFIKENGGNLATFAEALKATENERAKDMQQNDHDHKGHGDHKM